MELAQALPFNHSAPVIALVGAGGKTSAMFLLAAELKSHGKRVLLTTTTAIFKPDRPSYDSLLLQEGSPPDLAGVLAKSLEIERTPGENRGWITVIANHESPDGKLRGITPAAVDFIAMRGLCDALLVEADGARLKPIKCPEEHEPQLPSSTTCVIAVIGLNAYHCPIDERYVHRPHRVVAVTSRNIGDLIDEKVIAEVAAARNGSFKGTPCGAAKVLLLNRCHTEEDLIIAGRVGRLVLDTDPSISRVIGATLKESPFVRLVLDQNCAPPSMETA